MAPPVNPTVKVEVNDSCNWCCLKTKAKEEIQQPPQERATSESVSTVQARVTEIYHEHIHRPRPERILPRSPELDPIAGRSYVVNAEGEPVRRYSTSSVRYS